jgi:hypothetical protein
MTRVFDIYHEAVGEELDAAVAKRGGGELKIAKVAGEYSGGQGHEVVDHVDEDSRCGEAEEDLQFDQGGQPEALEAR